MAYRAHVEYLGDWAPIAEIKQTAFLDAERTANSIVRIVNDYQSKRDLISKMIEALELCIDNRSITWEAEQAAGVVIRRAKNLM